MMAHTIATMRTSTKEQRRNRKQQLLSRIRREVRRHNDEQITNIIMRSIKSDIAELVEIGHVEGYQCGVNDTKNKGVQK